MSKPELTYELIIKVKTDNEQDLLSTKEEIKSWLFVNDITSFVEGSVDDIFYDSETHKGFEDFVALGGDKSPISIFRFGNEELEGIKQSLQDNFSHKVCCQIRSLSTLEWSEGWKDGFKPIYTEQFVVLPPWEKVDNTKVRHHIVIEPGMAFGTGQHATTVLCLRAMEHLAASMDKRSLQNKTVIDVGTGTGILAIGAKKLGFKTVVGTDIDEDSVNVAKQNAKDNGVEISVFKGSFPPPTFSPQKYDLVIANILANVLERLKSELIALVNDQGFLILSGLLEEEAAQIKSIYTEDSDLIFKRQESQDGWVALSFEKVQ